MNRRALTSITLSLTTLGAMLYVGCGGKDVPVLQNGSQDLGTLDAGTGNCGAAPCKAGELCCASADESCSPTCLAAVSCPAYGRPCKIDAGSGDSGTGDSGPTGLEWFTECGPPLCKVRPADAGPPPPSSCAKAGTPCTTKGEECGTSDEYCDTPVVVCDDHDPKGPSGNNCPISTKKAKDGITYVDPAELEKLHDETIAIRLATYRYKGPFVDPKDPNAKHLGFVIEDQPQSLSVDRGHDRVDLYGYMSMAVATMQVQEKEIAALRRELDDVKTRCVPQKK